MGSGIIYTLDCRADSEHSFAALAVLYQAASATMTGTSGSNGPNWKYEADQINMFQTLTCRCSLFVDDPVSNNWCDRVHEEKVGPILSSSDAWQRTWWRPCLVFLGLFTRRFLLRHLILIELHCLHTELLLRQSNIEGIPTNINTNHQHYRHVNILVQHPTSFCRVDKKCYESKMHILKYKSKLCWVPCPLTQSIHIF